MENSNTVSVTIPERAEIEVINFDENTSWIRWMMPDWSDNGNVNLPTGKNYKLKERNADTVIVEVV